MDGTAEASEARARRAREVRDLVDQTAAELRALSVELQQAEELARRETSVRRKLAAQGSPDYPWQSLDAGDDQRAMRDVEELAARGGRALQSAEAAFRALRTPA